MRTFIARLALLVVSIVLPATVAAQALYGSAYVGGGGAGGPATLYSINPTTGAATPIGPIGFNGVGSLAFFGARLYGVANGSGNTLITINTTTGVGTAIGPLGVGGVQDIAFRGDGTLFGYIAGSIYTINTTTGAATLVGATGGGFPDGNGLTFAGNTLILGNDAGGTNGALYTINQATGAQTLLVNLAYGAGFNTGNDPRPAGMTVNASGLLFATIIEGHPGSVFRLATINPTTGAVTNVGTTVSGLDALAIAPVLAQVPTLSLGSLVALVLAVLGTAIVASRQGWLRTRTN